MKTKTFVFQNNLPSVVDEDQLSLELQTVASGASAVHSLPTEWEKWPYNETNKPEGLDEPVDPSLPYSQPELIIVSNVPKNVDRGSVKIVVQAHSSPEDSKTKRDRKAARKLVKQILKAPDSVLTDLKNKLNSL